MILLTDKDKLLDVSMVAKRLGKSKDTVRDLIRLGLLRATDTSTGKRPTYRIRELWLDEYLKNNEVE